MAGMTQTTGGERRLHSEARSGRADERVGEPARKGEREERGEVWEMSERGNRVDPENSSEPAAHPDLDRDGVDARRRQQSRLGDREVES